MTTRATIDGRAVTPTGAIVLTRPNAVLVIESSDLGRGVMEGFPEAITVKGIDRTETFWRTQRAEHDRDGDLIAVIYDSGDPKLPLLHVLND